MRVDIVGRGIIPGLGSNAPVYNKDMSELEIGRVLKFASLKVYLAGTSVAVIRRNLHELIILDNSPKKASKDTPVKKTAKAATVTETAADVQEAPAATVEATEEETIQEETTVTSADETTSVEETETTAEATTFQQQSKSSKKKNRR